jgi:SPP1 gp7 family putative phage head morphogenesis protein
MQTALLKQGTPIPHADSYTALHLRLEKMHFEHECGHEHINLASLNSTKKAFKQVVSAFEKAANHVFDNKVFSSKNITDEPVQAYIGETYNVLKDSMQKGIAYEVPKTMQRALEQDLFVFSGMKAYTALREVGSLAFIDEKGTPKSWHQFKQDADRLNVAYNNTYLQTEYNFVNHSASQASKWVKFEEDGDDYNLQYRTAEDNKVRADHQTLAGTTLPPSDNFWNDYTPPNGWNCRCVTVQVRKEKYTVSDSEKAIKMGEEATTKIDKNGKNSMEIFRFNPGKQQKLIPPKHPYLSGDCGKLSATLKTLNLSLLSLADKRKVASAVDKCKARKEVEKLFDGVQKEINRKSREDTRQHYDEKIEKGEKIKVPTTAEYLEEITISRGNIKTLVSKPHDYFLEKNEAIKDLPKLLNKSKYIGWAKDEEINGEQKHPFVEHWQYYEVTIADKKSFICVKITKENEYIPHSVENYKDLKNIKGLKKKEKPPKVG